jgi:hypothetical protein
MSSRLLFPVIFDSLMNISLLVLYSFELHLNKNIQLCLSFVSSQHAPRVNLGTTHHQIFIRIVYFVCCIFYSFTFRVDR